MHLEALKEVQLQLQNNKVVADEYSVIHADAKSAQKKKIQKKEINKKKEEKNTTCFFSTQPQTSPAWVPCQAQWLADFMGDIKSSLFTGVEG